MSSKRASHHAESVTLLVNDFKKLKREAEYEEDEELSEYMMEHMDCVICKRTNIPRYMLRWTVGAYTDTCKKCFTNAK